MLLNSTYNSSSLVSFLSSVIQENSTKIKSRFLYIDIFYNNEFERKKILNFLPYGVIKDDPVNSRLIIKKSDIIYFRTKVHNPFRIISNGKEYDTRLMMYLLFEATDLWKIHCFDIYNAIKGPYHHDMRVNVGVFQNLMNCVFESQKHSGRMEKDCIGDLTPLCFPDPELLKSKVQIHHSGNYHIFLSKEEKHENSVLFKVVSKKLKMLELLECTMLFKDAKLEKLLYQKKCLEEFIDCIKLQNNGLLVVPFYIFHETLSVLLSDQVIVKEIENLLKVRQQRNMLSSFIYRFFQDKNIDLVDSSSVIGLKEARNLYKKHIGSGDNLSNASSKVEKAISSLQNVKLNITANLDFFIKINGDKGILRAQQYFRGLTSLIDAEIYFLKNFKDILTIEDLEFFLKVTCKGIHYDINRLLTVCDFFTQRKIIDRNAILKFTKKEIAELTKYMNYRIILLKEIVKYMNENAKVVSLDGNFVNQRVIYSIISDHPILSTQFIKNNELITYINVLELIKSIRYVEGKWLVDEERKNKWLLCQLKLHPLMDYLDIDLSNVPNELWGKELNESIFLNILQSIIDSNRTGKKLIYEVKVSTSLRILQILYNISHFIPFSSLWLYHINPSRYRTVPGYVGHNIREKLYTKNKKIPVTSFSSRIIKGLKLDVSEERFVESYYEARFLKRKIRKDNNTSGKFEKLKTSLSSNKFVAYILLGVVFVITLTCAVVGRVFAHFNIIPGIVVNRIIDGVRGIFDTFFVICGLDSVVDKALIFILDVAGIVVRIIDFVLLCGLLSELVRAVINLVCVVVNHIYNICEDIYKSLKLYGFKDSCIILLTKICSTKESKVENSDLENKDDVEKCDIHSGLIGTLNRICDGTKDKDTVLLRVSNIAKDLSSQVNQVLYCGKPRLEILLRHFETSTSNLVQDVVNNVNYIKLKYEFSYLLNNYVERFSYRSSEGNISILNSLKERSKFYDKITAINLQTKYFQKSSRIKIHNSDDIKRIFNKVNNMSKCVTVESLNKKIASLKWSIHMLDVHNVYRIKDESELVSLNTKIDHSITVVLYDCILRLENYRKRIQSGELISEDFINTDIDCNFLPYISDVYYILQSIDNSLILSGQTESTKTFFDTFFSRKLFLKDPSDQAKNLADVIAVDKGTVSCFSRIKNSICDFMEYFQNPKSIAISFILYYLIRLTNSVALLNAVDYVSQITDHVLDVLMLEELYDYFTRTDFGKLLLLEFYQRGIFLKDITFMFSEFNLGFLTDSVQQDTSILHCQNINYFIYSSSFHVGNVAQERLSLVVNGFARIIYEGTFIGLIRQVIHCFRKKMMYNIQYFMLRENIVSDSIGFKDVSDRCDPTNLAVLSLEREVSCANNKGKELFLGRIDEMLDLSGGLNSVVVKGVDH